ncbi:MAG: DUF4350 domain-containing protein [Bryobacteraceae bacterium]|jgi:uncharacterized protein DUF4350
MKPWPRRVLIAVLAVAALLAFLVPNVRRSAALMTHPDPVGPTVYSKSALGHAAWYRLLESLGTPVAISESGAGAHLETGSVLVIAEPRLDETTLQEVGAMLSTGTVLLILPKRTGKSDPHRPNWIGEDQLVPLAAAATVLRLADPSAKLVRDAAANSWTGSLPGAPSIRAPQLIHSRILRPLLASGDGILIGERRLHGRRIMVLSDPDLIANYSLARGDNAAISFALIENLRAGRDGAVVFDEFVHGFSPRAFQLLGILFQFPFVLVTLQLALAIALAVWAATGRFGMPAALPPPIEAGKRSLIEAGARLLDRWGHTGALAERYFEAQIRDAAREMRAPRGLDTPALLAWFAQIGRAAPDPRQSAQAVYAWRKELNGGSGKHAQSR